MDLFTYLPWMALLILSAGYWFQVWKVHKLKEVKDLSVLSYLCLATGFVIMGWQAHIEGSTIFLVKQMMTLVPVILLLGQMWLYRAAAKELSLCGSCEHELDDDWKHCAHCGAEIASVGVGCVSSEGVSVATVSLQTPAASVAGGDVVPAVEAQRLLPETGRGQAISIHGVVVPQGFRVLLLPADALVSRRAALVEEHG